MRSGIRALDQALANDPTLLIAPLAVFAATFAIGYLLRQVLLRILRAWHSRAASRPRVLLTEAVRVPTFLWILILSVHVAIQFSELPPRFTAWTPQALLVLFIFSLTLMCMRIARDLVRYYGDQVPGALPVSTLTQTLAELGIVILGFLIILNQLHVSIAPILTALGVGGLAVALALQDTLSNLFAGFYVAVAGQVRLGDYIKLDTGEEGYVTDISWRTTTIRTLGSSLIIVPNSKLAKAVVTNYHLPEKRIGSQVQVNVSYDSDPEKVERVLLEVGTQAAHEIPGMLAEPAPSVAFDPGFGESSLGFSLNYQVAEFANQFGVRNELRRRILRRFREELIEMPITTRRVLLREDASHD
jgi:small-conductance mechanosensitive channel